MIAQFRGNWDEAEEYFKASLEMKREIGDKQGVATTMHHLGMIAQNRGNWDEAEEYMKEAQEIVKEIGDKQGVAFTMGALGRLSEDRDLFEDALRLFLNAAYILNQTGSSYEQNALDDLLRMIEKVTVERFKEMILEEVEDIRDYVRGCFPNL